jgi:hypothetical protein
MDLIDPPCERSQALDVRRDGELVDVYLKAGSGSRTAEGDRGAGA